ncbi:hypothetical protein NKJ48_31690 [Mesorhizobium sp. M0114]|uniref:hypothetical protein n=1 Tax=unclassified Mesorhizobium TaxID=325217 RepID=UPI00333786CF
MITESGTRIFAPKGAPVALLIAKVKEISCILGGVHTGIRGLLFARISPATNRCGVTGDIGLRN